MNDRKIARLLPPDFALRRLGSETVIFRKGWEDDLSKQRELIRSGREAPLYLEGRGRNPVFGGGDRAVVWRRCLHGGLLRGIFGDRFASARRVVDEIRLLEEARQARVGVPEPLGGIVRRAGLFFVRCRLATRFLSGSRDLLSYFRKLSPAPVGGLQEEKNRLVEGFGRLVCRMHAAGFDHADLQLKNLLFAGLGRNREFFVIDFDRSRRRRRMSAGRRANNLLRLHRSYLKMCFFTGRDPGTGPLRFLRAYVPGDRELRRYLFEKVKSGGWRVGVHRLGWKISKTFRGGCYPWPVAR